MATTMNRRPDQPPPDSVAVFSYEEIIGDGLYKLPFVRMVRAAYPSARITWITTRKTVYAGRLQPLMDGLIDEFRQDSGIGVHVSGLLKPLPFRERFGVIIDTQTTLWRTLTIRRMPHDLFVSGALGFRLSDAKPPPSQIRPPHMVDRLADLLRLAAGSVPKVEAGLRLPEPLVAKAEAALPPGRRYVGLAPGAGKRFKCWPLDRFVAVARAQVERDRVPVFILGPDELEWMPHLKEAVPAALFPEQDREVWGDEFTPLRTIALARRFAAAVANDSGVSHMFGAADIPLVTLFGPTPAAKFQPRVTSGGAMTAQEFGGRDMAAIPAQAVIERLDRLAIHPIDQAPYSKNS
ncbi:lipopolysaccharide heptosyltransferase family protein [Skermanella mucosa]|uniref:glycosyltransferase family 9 protein n=1 Tax=Skermanella mucosa TaxID=1789672 RepID=UPI001E556F11|nr:glycosyltransferase family 9 protein [Skermanella mucosa]UEM21684.1 lipopolysaccharide heptosyltransferase family protein [Skermanella mucosa]